MKDKDNVHLRVDGYNSLADGIIDAVEKMRMRKDTASISVSAGGNRTKPTGGASTPPSEKTTSFAMRSSSRSHRAKPYTIMMPFGRK
jgi:hypothetical protein